MTVIVPPKGVWPIEATTSCPPGTRSCMGCGVLIADDPGAVQSHFEFHQVLNLLAEKVLK